MLAKYALARRVVARLASDLFELFESECFRNCYASAAMTANRRCGNAIAPGKLRQMYFYSSASSAIAIGSLNSPPIPKWLGDLP